MGTQIYKKKKKLYLMEKKAAPVANKQTKHGCSQDQLHLFVFSNNFIFNSPENVERIVVLVLVYYTKKNVKKNISE